MTDIRITKPSLSVVTQRPGAVDRSARARPADKVDTAERSRVAEVTRQTQQVAGRRRSELLSELKAKIKAGTYRPDPGAIADAILREAELDAQLRSML